MRWLGSILRHRLTDSVHAPRQECENSEMEGIVKIECSLIVTNDTFANIVSCPVQIDDNGVGYDATLFMGYIVFEAQNDNKDV